MPIDDDEPRFMTFDWGHLLKEERNRTGKYGKRDALDRPVPKKGALKVWMDRRIWSHPAPEGWIHVPSSWDVFSKLLGGRVVELSLSNDPSDRSEYGTGVEVLQFIEQNFTRHHLLLWPRDGLRIHSQDPAEIEALRKAIVSLAKAGDVTIEGRPDPNGGLFFEPVNLEATLQRKKAEAEGIE